MCKRPLPRSCTFKLNCMYFWIIAHCCKGKFYPNPSYSHQNTTNQAITHSSIQGAGQYMGSRRVGTNFQKSQHIPISSFQNYQEKKATSRLFWNAECWRPPRQNLYLGTYILNKHIILALKWRAMSKKTSSVAVISPTDIRFYWRA